MTRPDETTTTMLDEESREYVADVLATLAELVDDEDDQWHRAERASGHLGWLVGDLTDAAAAFMDADDWPYNAALAAEFIRFARPRALVGKCCPLPADVAYVPTPTRALAEDVGRDEWLRADWLLALAGLRSYGMWVAPWRLGYEPMPGHWVWGLYASLAAELWLSQEEWRELHEAHAAIMRALTDRFAVRKKPLPEKVAVPA